MNLGALAWLGLAALTAAPAPHWQQVDSNPRTVAIFSRVPNMDKNDFGKELPMWKSPQSFASSPLAKGHPIFARLAVYAAGSVTGTVARSLHVIAVDDALPIGFDDVHWVALGDGAAPSLEHVFRDDCCDDSVAVVDAGPKRQLDIGFIRTLPARVLFDAEHKPREIFQKTERFIDHDPHHDTVTEKNAEEHGATYELWTVNVDGGVTGYARFSRTDEEMRYGAVFDIALVEVDDDKHARGFSCENETDHGDWLLHVLDHAWTHG